ncbi:NTP/NDP exchange transporter [Coralloluteibacterium thermophilus]|uniref:NTP/NDP exchange transporter n=1 Tax=Coralloluteibacterium thermophilum TaxID=2707049 RepID=A0ABV9NH49_9GAMM
MPAPLQRPREALRRIPRSTRAPLVWAFLYFFFLLTGYYVLRPVRDAMGASADVAAVFPTSAIAWFGARGIDLGDFTLQVLFTGTFVAMVVLQPLYGALVSRVPRRVFLPVVYLLFIACLVGFYFAFDSGLPGRGAAFFVFVAVFNLFAVAVFWSFMADVFADHEARAVYGYIGAGGTLGGLLGPELTGLLVGSLGVANMLLISAGFLGLCVLCILMLWPHAGRRTRAAGDAETIGGSVLAGLRLVAREPLLRAIAMLMFFGVGVGTLLYNEQAAIVRALAADDAVAAVTFYSRLDRYINWLVLVIQVLLTRRLLARFGVAKVLLIPAVAVLGGYALLAASPLPILVAIVQVATRAGEFSLGKPARETIYTRVAPEWRYKAKAAIDTVVYRGGDLTFVWLHKALALGGSHVVFGVGFLVAAAMTLGAWRVGREQAKLPA